MFITPAFAQATGGSPAAFGPDMLVQFLPFILIFVIMYFLIIRPQRNRQKQTQEMIANIRRGDTIVTTGGFIGKVAKVDENELQVDLADNVRVRVVRGMVSEVRAKGEPVKEEA
ncbi:MAG TPA: preprotein translocase subunit YajC [Bauldia sp.]|nr:preprotein translocase subunit YajC [Bauldia sp.]